VSAAPPRLSVVIPSWNTRELLRVCLEHLAAAEKPATEVIVVENGSEDGSGAMVAERFPNVRLLSNARNEGFARGCNQGIAAARGEVVLLLNSDTEVRPDALARLVDFLDAHPEYGAAAPRLVDAQGETIRSVQAFPTWKTPFFWGTPVERWLPSSKERRRYLMLEWDQASARDVDQPPAACLLIRRAALERVGSFDERLWLFYNDVDLSKRLAQAGFRTRYVADALVMHHVGASTSRFGSFIPEYQKNRLYYFRKHHGRLAGAWLKACATLSWLDMLWSIRARRRAGLPAASARHITGVWLRLLVS
jgi:GT2 family glycosyltransferase